jgi:hypothetical protein
MTATCKHCDTTFYGVDRSEDGEPEVPESTRCAEPGCEVYLCAAACEHFSFECGGCGQRFCDAHKIQVAAGLDCCPACAAECEPERKPVVMVRAAAAVGVA